MINDARVSDESEGPLHPHDVPARFSMREVGWVCAARAAYASLDLELGLRNCDPVGHVGDGLVEFSRLLAEHDHVRRKSY
jgi:hypothetical protein